MSGNDIEGGRRKFGTSDFLSEKRDKVGDLTEYIRSKMSGRKMGPDDDIDKIRVIGPSNNPKDTEVKDDGVSDAERVRMGLPFSPREFVKWYEKRFSHQMEVLYIGGVHPSKENKSLLNPYTNETNKEDFRNIGEHCLAVAYCAGVLANYVLGANDPREKNFVIRMLRKKEMQERELRKKEMQERALLEEEIVSRALVHDVAKGFEIMRKDVVEKNEEMNEEGSNIIMVMDPYSVDAYQAIGPILKKQGVAPHIAEYMAHAGEETGHNSLKSFVEIKDGTPVLKTKDNLSDMIVHLADDMTYTPIPREDKKAGETEDTYYLTAPERMKASDFRTRHKKLLYEKGFGFKRTDNELVLVEKEFDTAKNDPTLYHVKTYADWQEWVAREISQHLVARIEPDFPPEEAEQRLKYLVNVNLERTLKTRVQGSNKPVSQTYKKFLPISKYIKKINFHSRGNQENR
jgi:hypothetical protein